MTPAVKAWAPAALWAACLFVQSSIPGQYYPPAPFWSADKAVHGAVFLVLGFLCAHALRVRARAPENRPRIFAAAAAMASLYGLSDEIHQLFVPGRSADWRDFAADAAGSAAGAWLYLAVTRARAPAR